MNMLINRLVHNKHSEHECERNSMLMIKNVLRKRGMCIKGLFWPPLEPKTESYFSPISSYWFVRRITQV